MGVIENGTIAGVVPEKTVFAVNYPGYPTSIARAVETLGGEDAISKARSSESNYLELRFRPEDAFAHPIFGELHGLSGLLLQVSRMQEAKNASQGLRAEVIAKVDQSYDFSGMADYQYVAPVHAKLLRNKKRTRFGHLQSEQGGLPDMEQEEMMILPPPLFSVKDMPEDLVLRPSEISRASQRQASLAEQPWEMDIVPCFNLDFKIKEIPPKINWEEKLHKSSTEWHIQSIIAKLFDERPIWAKATINDQLVELGICLSDAQLRRFLFRTSYYFAYGPFRTLWIRNGYDPRKDPESRIHQMIDFRVPKPVREAAHAFSETGEQMMITWSKICSFKEAPSKKFSYLQLYDLKDDYIQEQIKRAPEQTTCNEYTGWFKRSTIVRLRHHIRIRFLSLIPGNIARDLEQLESRKLAVLKRLDQIETSQTQNEEKSINDTEQEVSHIDVDLAGTSPHKSNLNSVSSDNDEEEEEEDNEDDEYQELQEMGLDNMSEIEHNYMGPLGSIPKNYLQELLEKFPMNADENMRTMSHVDLSDEDAEYAIYDYDDEDNDDGDNDNDDGDGDNDNDDV